MMTMSGDTACYHGISAEHAGLLGSQPIHRCKTPPSCIVPASLHAISRLTTHDLPLTTLAQVAASKGRCPTRCSTKTIRGMLVCPDNIIFGPLILGSQINQPGLPASGPFKAISRQPGSLAKSLADCSPISRLFMAPTNLPALDVHILLLWCSVRMESDSPPHQHLLTASVFLWSLSFVSIDTWLWIRT